MSILFRFSSALHLLSSLPFVVACSSNANVGGGGGAAGAVITAGAGGAIAGSSALPGGAAGTSTNGGTAGSSVAGAASAGAPLGGGGGAAGSAPVAGSGGVSGGAGASGAAGTAGMGNSCKSGSPTAASAGVNFPFPQRRFSEWCVYPTTCSDEDVRTGWQNYKAKFIVDGGNGTLRVQRPENENDTVSEGIAYGMLFAVYLNDKDTFDKLWGYAKSKLDQHGLMHWQIHASGQVGGSFSATDSDEDMGFALVMADEQWGGYTDETKAFLGKVAEHDFHDDGTIRGGDNYDDVNPSYLAPAFYRTFAKYTGDSRWNTILTKSYDILEGAMNQTTGLVPDWSSGNRGRDYKYDAARTPYRIALDACWNNEPRAKAYAEKVSAFFAGVGVPNIRDGYALDGMRIGAYQNSTFIGPAGTAAMVGKQQTFLDEAYAFSATDLREGTESYFNMSWAMFAAMMMTGNFVDLTQY